MTTYFSSVADLICLRLTLNLQISNTYIHRFCTASNSMYVLQGFQNQINLKYWAYDMLHILCNIRVFGILSFVDLHVLLHVMMITFSPSESPSSSFMELVQFTYQSHYTLLRVYFVFNNWNYLIPAKYSSNHAHTVMKQFPGSKTVP